MSSPDVLCVGIAVVDVLGKPIDDVPAWDELATFDHVEQHTGGCAVNTAVDLVRLGVTSGVSACVGVDGSGLYLRHELEAAGVDASSMVETRDAATSYTFVMIDSNGRRRYLHHVGANACFTLAGVPREKVRGTRILHMGGSLLMPALDGAPTAELLADAQAHGVITSMDTAFNPRVDARALIEPCLPHLDILMPSIEEAREITGETTPEAMLDALDGHGITTIGVKLGAEGCVLRHEGRTLRLPAYPVEVVDGSGAGDAFMAGFLYGRLQGWDVEDCARMATATAAHCIQAIGCSAGVPPARDVQSFMASR
ncbi:MAG: carbohydrate kinase [Armatimonadia bacterium]|nr:carbohydrate kinase [Armatimonadia bacterium]